MNKNDLRYIKTERLIVHTYVDMRLRDPSPVKVSDLCREALINKTTFYSHYDTMESLHRHICRETVADILGRCDCAQMAFSDTYALCFRAGRRDIARRAAHPRALRRRCDLTAQRRGGGSFQDISA